MSFLDRFIGGGIAAVFLCVIWCIILLLMIAFGYDANEGQPGFFVRIVCGSLPAAFLVGFIFPQITGV